LEGVRIGADRACSEMFGLPGLGLDRRVPFPLHCLNRQFPPVPARLVFVDAGWLILQLKIVFEQKKLVSVSEKMSDAEDTVNNNNLRGKLSVLNCR